VAPFESAAAPKGLGPELGGRLRLGVVDDPTFDEHRADEYHPERPERSAAARAGVARAQVEVSPVAARPATREELSRVHSPRYVEALEQLAGHQGLLDSDTYLAPGSVRAAEHAAGGATALVDALLDGQVDRGVALLRPPGHHARPEAAMGFCLLNNVAVAAAHAIGRGLDRVAIVDWDVHHGNGTQEMFFTDPRVLYVSLHQWPFYPGTGAADEVGAGAGRGYTVNIPLSEGARTADYVAAFDRIVLPILESYAPELVLVSAGFDAHRDDPLAGMQLDASAYAWMTAALTRAAEKSAEGKIGLFLEGGYDLTALELCLMNSVQALTGARTEGFSGPPTERDVEIRRAEKELAPYWPVGASAG
jgi:acetoin utilization deacetylase AcuC-like enzyme